MEIGMHPNSNRTKVCVSRQGVLETPEAQINFHGIFYFYFFAMANRHIVCTDHHNLFINDGTSSILSQCRGLRA
jgi:hypothetical protein